MDSELASKPVKYIILQDWDASSKSGDDMSQYNLRYGHHRTIEDVNLWERITHEYHENWATTSSNDSTV